MLRILSQKLPLVVALAMSLSACGTSSNFNQIFGKDEESADAMLEIAKAAYDRGDFAKSEELATKLLDRNPDNESAALVLGYTYLSMGGIDPYRLARELIKLDTKDKTATTGTVPTTGQSLLQDDANKSSDASSTLTQLGALINLEETDFEALASTTFAAGDADNEIDGDNNGVEPSLFVAGTNKLFIPARVNDELRAKVEVLTYMNKAVKTVCRFVDDAVKTEDIRHQDPSCAATTASRSSPAKSHFLWAFSHLTESLVYQSVLLYSGAKNGTSNFQVASGTLDQTQFSGENALGDFVSKVTELKNATDAVFDTTNSDSMLRATLNDLTAVTLAFDQITGLPEGIKNRIVNAFKKINEVGDTLGGGSANNAGALKGQMTEKFAKTVGGKVDKVVSEQYEKVGEKFGTKITSPEDLEKDEKIPAEAKAGIQENITKACSSYDTLSNGLPPEKVAANKPANCPAAK